MSTNIKAAIRLGIQQQLNQIEFELSPENISWDGERPEADIRSATRALMARKAELEAKLERQLNRIY